MRMNENGFVIDIEYLEYNAFYDIDIRVIKDVLEDYKQKNL